MRKSAKKEQSQVHMIQRTVTSRSVTQDNSNINKFWKSSHWGQTMQRVQNNSSLPHTFFLTYTRLH